MNTSEIAWISGWASDISIWEDEIYECFSNFSHRFVDYWDLISSEDFVVPKSGIVVGWSMGTLVLLKNLHKKPKEQRWILVCPIADFCACWPRAIVRATTLTSFSDLMADVPKEEMERWLENASRYSPEQLTAGLNYLIQKKADLTEPAVAELELFFGEKDKVVPLAQKDLFSSGKVCENLGHWLPDYFSEIHKAVCR